VPTASFGERVFVAFRALSELHRHLGWDASESGSHKHLCGKKAHTNANIMKSPPPRKKAKSKPQTRLTVSRRRKAKSQNQNHNQGHFSSRFTLDDYKLLLCVSGLVVFGFRDWDLTDRLHRIPTPATNSPNQLFCFPFIIERQNIG